MIKDLEADQKRRRTRTQRNSLDLALTDLTAFYRDVLALQLGSRVAIANADAQDALDRLAHGSSPKRPSAASRRSPPAVTPWTAMCRRCWRWRR